MIVIKKKFYLTAFLSLSTLLKVHGASLVEGFESFGFKDSDQQKALFLVMRQTGGFTLPNTNENDDPKKKSHIELYHKSNLKEFSEEVNNANEMNALEVASKITFPSLQEVQAYTVAATQNLWFRSAWEKEVNLNPEALLKRWVAEKENVQSDLTHWLTQLGLVEEVIRPLNYIPHTIIWLGAIQPSAEPRIYGDIPEGYEGEIVVHSNRRGLILNKDIFESYGVLNIAEQLNLGKNEEAHKIIESVCRGYEKTYDLSYSKLETATEELKIKIIEALKDKGILKENNDSSFKWPTEKELYTYTFSEAQKRIPQKLSKASLTFNDPEPRNDGRIYNTYTEARYWSNKQSTLSQNDEKRKILALSVQPFVSYQHSALDKALGDKYEVVTVGPASPNAPQKDRLESLAKIIYEKVSSDQEIKNILPWIR